MILEGKDDDGVVDQSDDSVVGGVGKLIFFACFQHLIQVQAK